MSPLLWMIYLITTGSGQMQPVPPWQFTSQQECQQRLVSLVDTKRITPPSDGMTFVCWPKPQGPS